MITNEDMKKFIDVFQMDFQRGEHAVVFCSNYYLQTRILQGLSINPFYDRREPVECFCANGNFLEKPRMLRLTHMLTVENAVHLLWIGKQMRENWSLLILSEILTSRQICWGGPIT